ncbi:hypothetical protein [Pseudonocardia sp. ICBG162]|uniref:hypothetical protein n=1 Tax=Pseudonocardia sp. ICBG162 TaxID=2846761 RepID=UPI001CF6E169|nr:hypothetical protein [Pseudonocardia sp. ICBG162]
MNDTQITAYLDRYAASLSSFDAAAAAELWAIPGTIIDDNFSGVLESREAMVAGLERSYPLYKKLGLASVRYDLIKQDRLSNGITQVHVRWLFYDVNDDLLVDSNAHYILRRQDDSIRACVCIQTDDAEKLQDLAAKKGIDLFE